MYNTQDNKRRSLRLDRQRGFTLRFPGSVLQRIDGFRGDNELRAMDRRSRDDYSRHCPVPPAQMLPYLRPYLAVPDADPVQRRDDHWRWGGCRYALVPNVWHVVAERSEPQIAAIISQCASTPFGDDHCRAFGGTMQENVDTLRNIFAPQQAGRALIGAATRSVGLPVPVAGRLFDLTGACVQQGVATPFPSSGARIVHFVSSFHWTDAYGHDTVHSPLFDAAVAMLAAVIQTGLDIGAPYIRGDVNAMLQNVDFYTAQERLRMRTLLLRAGWPHPLPVVA